MMTLSRVEVAERMTAEEFFRDAPEDRKAELIDGALIVPSPPLEIHERLLLFLLRLLAEFVEQNKLGEVRGSRTPVQLDDDQTFEPDILFVSRARLEILQSKGVFGAPDFVVEVLSKSTALYDRGSKFREYERAGVREFWLLDPYGPAGTEFYQRQGKRFAAVMPDREGWVTSIAVPGFRIRTEWLWNSQPFVTVRDALQKIQAQPK
ncbi:MAG: Uma2 family endonuclease [Chloroflexi bacterium]|nr:Uma2 family endonuclease [Chloroflexota bacterium]